MKKNETSQLVALASVVAVLMIALQIASKAVRDGFFLTEFDVTMLPVATLGAATVSFATAFIFGKFIATFTPMAAVPVLFGINGLLFFGEAALTEAHPRAVAAFLYLHTAAFGGAVVSGFWSVINERFDPYTARKVMGKIAGGATFGGVIGGVLTWVFSDVSTVILLAAFGVASMLCAISIGVVARGAATTQTEADESERASAPLFAGLVVLRDYPYPRLIGVVVFLVALMTGMIDYVFKAGVVEASDGELVGFFAVFYTVVGIATFATQAFSSKRLLEWLGVVPTVALLPVVAVVLLVGAILLPGIVAFLLLRGGAMVTENSIYRSGYELLYTAVPPDQKRSAKVLIDLGFDRLGTATASGLVLAALAIGFGDVNMFLLLSALTSALGCIAILALIRREYVASLGQRLRDALSSRQSNPIESLKMLASTFVSNDDLWAEDSIDSVGASPALEQAADSWEAVREKVQTLARRKRSSPDASVHVEVSPRSGVDAYLLNTPLRGRLRDIDPADSEWSALRRSAPGAIGQLGDILLSRREPVEVRIRAIDLLAAVPSKRAATCLVEALESDTFRVRRAAALALLTIVSVSPALRPDRAMLSRLAARELRLPSLRSGERTGIEATSPFFEDARGNEISASLELAFILLAIGGQAERLRLALTAITSEDPRQRGTGLEYLDNLLPADLRTRVIALAERPELTQADQRVSSDVVDRLAEEFRNGDIKLHELRERYRKTHRKRQGYRTS